MSLKYTIQGQTFGFLTVEKQLNCRLWQCRCVCGQQVKRTSYHLRRGFFSSCGCIRNYGKVRHGKRQKQHQRAPEYTAWTRIKQYCLNPKSKAYPRYGGRGITVCERWRDSFEAFLTDMGPRPGPLFSVDRYPDNDGNYEPGNCRWATPTQQQRNRSTNRLLTLGDRTMTLVEWSEATHIPPITIGARLKRGWTVERALTQEVL